MAVVALLTDVTARLRLTEALKGWSAPVECVAHIRDVRDRLGRGDLRALVVGPTDAARLPTPPLVAELRRDHPSVTVVAYCAAGLDGSADIVALVQAGAHALVVRGIDDERHAFRTALRGAEQRCAAALVYDEIRAHLPPAVAPLVALYLRADGDPPTVAEAAQALGVHRKTLVNRLAAAGCPTPRALRTWCRLFVAARLLEEPGRTVHSVADQLEFDSTTGLRNALKRYTGRGACAIRAAGGLAHVIAQFNADCAARRRSAERGERPALPPADPVRADRADLSPAAPPAGAPAQYPPPHTTAARRSALLATACSRALVLVGGLWLQMILQAGLDGAADALLAAAF